MKIRIDFVDCFASEWEWESLIARVVKDPVRAMHQALQCWFLYCAVELVKRIYVLKALSVETLQKRDATGRFHTVQE